MKYFAHTNQYANRSFLYKNRRVVIKDGVVATADKVVIAALEDSAEYTEVDAPVTAKPAAVSTAAQALIAGAAPKPAANSTDGTTVVGISTSAALAALKKDH